MHPARHHDLPAVQSLYHQAIERTARTGGYIDWPYPFPVDRIKRYLDDGSLYKFVEEEQAVATLRLYEDCSPEIWPDVRTTNALYLGKIATGNAVSGRGYMLDQILPNAINHAAINNYDYVRFDSLATNERQLKLYKQSDFQIVGHATIRSINNGNTIELMKWQLDLV